MAPPGTSGALALHQMISRPRGNEENEAPCLCHLVLAQGAGQAGGRTEGWKVDSLTSQGGAGPQGVDSLPAVPLPGLKGAGLTPATLQKGSRGPRGLATPPPRSLVGGVCFSLFPLPSLLLPVCLLVDHVSTPSSPSAPPRHPCRQSAVDP